MAACGGAGGAGGAGGSGGGRLHLYISGEGSGLGVRLTAASPPPPPAQRKTIRQPRRTRRCGRPAWGAHPKTQTVPPRREQTPAADRTAGTAEAHAATRAATTTGGPRRAAGARLYLPPPPPSLPLIAVSAPVGRPVPSPPCGFLTAFRPFAPPPAVSLTSGGGSRPRWGPAPAFDPALPASPPARQRGRPCHPPARPPPPPPPLALP